MWQRAFKKLIGRTFKRNFDPLQHMVAEEITRTKTPVMGYMRDNGDIVVQPIEKDNQDNQTLRATGTSGVYSLK